MIISLWWSAKGLVVDIAHANSAIVDFYFVHLDVVRDALESINNAFFFIFVVFNIDSFLELSRPTESLPAL